MTDDSLLLIFDEDANHEDFRGVSTTERVNSF